MQAMKFKTTVVEVEQIIEGILIGLFEKEIPVKECVADAETIVGDFEKVYYYLKKGFNLADIAESFQFIGDALKKLPKTISECESCAGIVGELEHIAELFASPVKFLEQVGIDIFWHRKEISADIKQARANWEAGNYELFGEFVGEMIAIAIGANDAVTVTESHAA